MPSIRVDIDDMKVWKQCNDPGGTGGVGKFRDLFCVRAKQLGQFKSPVNDPRNALHRGGVVGTYKASWRVSRPLSPAYIAAGRIANTAGHASVVEWGRSESYKYQRFSWTRWSGRNGRIRWVGTTRTGKTSPWGRRTRSRPGRHVMWESVEGAWTTAPGLALVARTSGPYVQAPGFI